jgi:hypothetical protein
MNQFAFIGLADRIADSREYDRHSARYLLQRPDGRIARGQDNIWGECHQFGRVFSNAFGNAGPPAIVDPHVAAVGPIRLGRRERLGAIQAAAPSFGVEVSPANERDAGTIERAVTAFASQSNGGLIVTASAQTQIHRDLIIALAARYRLPAVYFERRFVAAGDLISYGPDFIDQYRRAAAYVDRILKGEKPAHLPVQAPTKYETVLNLKTAKALGLTIPETLLATADELIQ